MITISTNKESSDVVTLGDGIAFLVKGVFYNKLNAASLHAATGAPAHLTGIEGTALGQTVGTEDPFGSWEIFPATRDHTMPSQVCQPNLFFLEIWVDATKMAKRQTLARVQIGPSYSKWDSK